MRGTGAAAGVGRTGGLREARRPAVAHSDPASELDRRRTRGSALPLLLAVLALAVGAGAWNYHRNWQAEQATPRPYRSYDDAQLAALIEAYAQEADALEARAGRMGEAGRAPTGAGRSALLGDRIAAFNASREAGEAQRRLRAEAGRHDGVLEALRAEQALRAQRGSGLALHLHRLTAL